MDVTVLVVFCVVYLGMILGKVPGLALDRTGVALLGAIVLIGARKAAPQEAWDAIDVPTIGLLFGLMVVSAQFRMSGFYAAVTHRIADAEVSPPALLALLIAVSGGLSALLSNDIICLAMAPILVEGCARRGLDPVPFLLALACSANVGSAATLIGNPQVMLIGQTLDLSFAGYLLDGGVPALLGLAGVWAVIAAMYRGKWKMKSPVPHVEAPPFNRWQCSKGLAILGVLVLGFLFAPVPREVLALTAAGILLLSRSMASRRMLGLVDWQLLVLFIGLFIVNHAFVRSGMLEKIVETWSAGGVDVARPSILFPVTVVLSNLVSNVPAVMLLLPLAHHPMAGPVLALSSTLAGNLLIVGSIANIIVVDQAARLGIVVTWRTHVRTGLPVTIVTLAIAALWLWLRAL